MILFKIQNVYAELRNTILKLIPQTNFQNNNLRITITNMRTTIEDLKRGNSVSGGKSFKSSILKNKFWKAGAWYLIFMFTMIIIIAFLLLSVVYFYNILRCCFWRKKERREKYNVVTFILLFWCCNKLKLISHIAIAHLTTMLMMSENFILEWICVCWM